MKYWFDNINTAEIEKICMGLEAVPLAICPTCGGSGMVAADNDTTNENLFLHVCGRCGAELEAVRPGKYQCPNCE